MRKLSFLILSFILVSCVHKDRALIRDVTVLDVLEGEGTVFPIEDFENLKFAEVPSERKPLIEMQGDVCVSPEQYQILKRAWIEHQKTTESYQSRNQCRY